jgi:ankyrin repeat protein
VGLLIDAGADVNTRGKNGNTPLHDAVSFGNLDMVKYLVSRGADVNAKNDLGLTPLMQAENTDDWQMEEFLRKRTR